MMNHLSELGRRLRHSGPGVVAVLLMAAIALAGCGDDNGTNSTSDDTIMPLAVGNKWVYRTTTYPVTGSMQSAPQDSVVTRDSILVVADTMIEGERWYIVGGSLYDEGGRTAFANRSDGMRVAIDVGGEQMQQWLFAKYPVTAGETYEIPLAATPVTVQSTDSTVTVPAGTYEVYAYAVVLGFGYADYVQFTPNVGLVYWEVWEPGPADGSFLRYQRELESVVLH
jgi:hypothetical protein